MIRAASQRAIERSWRAVPPTSRRSPSSRPRCSAIIVSVFTTAIEVRASTNPRWRSSTSACPPTQTVEGSQAAHEIRRRHPETGIVLLSQYVEVGVATQLLAATPQRLGYLLKDRVADPEEFVASLRRVAGGGTVLDPKVVSGLLADRDEAEPLRSLSQREREVLELVAQGRSNKAIGERLAITQGAVQKHVSTIFNKLGLPAGEDDDRRILAVLAYLHPEQ
jgi:DNA-binding NarL/FixJ family response regulator